MKVKIEIKNSFEHLTNAQKLIAEIIYNPQWSCNYESGFSKSWGTQIRQYKLTEAAYCPNNAPHSQSTISIEISRYNGIQFSDCRHGWVTITIEGIRGSIEDIILPIMRESGFNPEEFEKDENIRVDINTTRPDVNWWTRTPENAKFF